MVVSTASPSVKELSQEEAISTSINSDKNKKHFVSTVQDNSSQPAATAEHDELEELPPLPALGEA